MSNTIEHLDEVYIWGTATLGNYVFEQCRKNKVKVLGFIDSNPSKQNNRVKDLPVYAPRDADTGKMVIISNIHWYDIQEQLISLGFCYWIYYEQLALLDCGFSVFYQAFKGMHTDLSKHTVR